MPKARSALITYGSETGNAQDIAEEISQIAERIHFIVRLCSLDEVELVRFSFSEEDISLTPPRIPQLAPPSPFRLNTNKM
jgi:sulfite reductase alpha subunit-like flavoprotein